MQVINWLELQPLPADLEALRMHLREALPLHRVCQLLVETILHAFPWTGRADLISCYHPSQTYEPGQQIALLIPESQGSRPTVWLLAQVKQARDAENPVQGRFQVVTLDIRGRQIQMAGGVSGASYPELDLSGYSLDDLAWLVDWVAQTYAAPLQAIIKMLIEKGEIDGQLAGKTFLPEPLSALSPELLYPCFARLSPNHPWTSLEEISKSLPELSHLKRETVLALLHAALKQSPYRSLGAGRWTTPELSDRLDREIPLGLPTSRIRSEVSIWTKRDRQELAGYEKKVIPAGARRALEELGFGEESPELDLSAWRPPREAVRLPAFNYLHSTQACFPVRQIMGAFATEMQMVFIQIINGDHQPFLLDRDNGLLKAVDPGQLRARILRDSIPAGTYLWLEYEGKENYRIAPRPLPFKRMAPCNLASIENNHLHIERTQISMLYEGASSLFKTDLSFKELEALFAEANRADLSVRDALIHAVQEICAADPDRRAHWSEIANAVFLQRICTPQSVLLPLYTQPCFEHLGDGYFRYKPVPDAPVRKVRKRKDRLSELWDNLLSDYVPPNPASEESASTEAPSESRGHVFPALTSDPGLASLSSKLEIEPAQISVPALSFVTVEKDIADPIVLKEETRFGTVALNNQEPGSFTSTGAAEPVITPWRDSLDKLLHSLEELVNDRPHALSAEEQNFESEEVAGIPTKADDPEAGPTFSPFRWDPKPAWLDVPIQPKPSSPRAMEAEHLVFRSKIPMRPLHKQRFYRRFFYYLRGWLSGLFKKTV